MDLSQMNADERSGYNNPDTMMYQVAAMAYGEMAGKSKEHKKMAISSFLNRINTREWEGETPKEILGGGYYAVQDKNDPYTWAATQDFPNEDAENEFKKVLSLTSAMFRGKVDKLDNQFYFTKDEIKDLKKEGDFDFSKVTSTDRGKVGKFHLLKYKE